jgi:hypothetical protein
MPLPDVPAALLTLLRSGAASSPDLERALGVSQSSVARALRALLADRRVVRFGATRGARYALPREIEGIGSSWPLRQIDRAGNVHDLGELHSLAANQYFLRVSDAAKSRGVVFESVTTGLPYYLQDQRPAGFLGRAVPLRYPELQLPQRVIDWNDDHYLRYLTMRGSDTIGDLILGDAAFDRFLADQARGDAIRAEDRATHYPQLADQVMAGGLPGSSAHGEHPKFAVMLREENGSAHRLVKFSPPLDTPLGQRWSDLLIAEHLAHEVLRSATLATARSRILSFKGRTYLEMERFDREGTSGRIGVVSLFAIDASLYGKLDNWIAAADRLRRDRRLEEQAVTRVRLVAAFGELIANTDRHFGNLSMHDAHAGRFELAPIYDMLPMLFAPEHDQIAPRRFQPPLPTSVTLALWPQARALAQAYWRALGDDARVGEEFRRISGECLRALEALPRTGAFADAATRP